MDAVDQALSRLKRKYPGSLLQRRPDGTALITIPEFRLSPHWNKPKTSLMFILPVGYPLAPPDTFWTDADLRLAHGGFPSNTDLNTRYGGPEPRLWFSFHPATWSPSQDDALTFVQLIRQRLTSP